MGPLNRRELARQRPRKSVEFVPIGILVIPRGVGLRTGFLGNAFHDETQQQVVFRVGQSPGHGLDVRRTPAGFKTASEMLETFGMHKGGKEYRRLVAAFERIFGATIFFGTGSTTPRAKVVQRSRFNFLREAQIWYDRQPDQRVLGEEFENVIVLSDEFYEYEEVTAHPIATDLEAVKVLGISAEAPFLVSDAMQRHGLGAQPSNAAIQFARNESVSAMRKLLVDSSDITQP